MKARIKNRRLDHARFLRTAKRTMKANLPGQHFRGGVRL